MNIQLNPKLLKKLFVAMAALFVFYFANNYIFVSEEDRIVQKLEEACELASFSEKFHPFVKLERAKELAKLFSPNVTVILKSPEGRKEKIYGQDNLVKHATVSNGYFSLLDFDFKDQNITIKGDNSTVNTTAVIKFKKSDSSKAERYAQEVIIKLTKTNGQWLINSAENVELLKR